MTDLASFRSIIELWGESRLALAAEFPDVPGLPKVTSTQVSKWFQRDSIPAEYWSVILATDTAVLNGVTAEMLTALAAREPAEARA